MCKDEILFRLTNLISDRQGISCADVNEHSSLAYDLNMDSLDIMELGMDIEYEFNISITDEELSKFKTVDVIVDIIASKF